MQNNGNYLVNGKNLTAEQLSMMTWRGLKTKGWVNAHSFWFKNGKPSTERGYYYPICNNFEWLFNSDIQVVVTQ